MAPSSRLICALTLFVIANPVVLADPTDSGQVPAGYELFFSDEFDGDSLDTDKWYYRTDAKHRSVQQIENVAVEDGALVLNLTLLPQKVRGKKAAGAGIVSREQFRYGYFEVRAQLGDGSDDDGDGRVDQGWHHAFWAMAAVGDENGHVDTTYPGIRRTEIDCYENASDDLRRFTQHIIVWKADGKEWGRLPKPPSDETDMGDDFRPEQWHTYAYEWTPEHVKFYVDGELKHTAIYPADRFEHDMVNLWLTAISANWNTANQEPSVARYDYIRAYRRVVTE